MFTFLSRSAVFAFVTLTAAALSFPVLAQQAAPAAAAPTYDVQFDVNGTVYLGTTTFAADRAGKVSGKLSVTSPATINGTLNGDIKEGTWTFDYAFTMLEENCSGTVAGNAKVAADQAEISGTVTIGGGCSAEAMTGTFSFKKKAK